MKTTGEGLYGKDNVDVTYVTSDSSQVTAARLDQAIDEVAKKTNPRDTFVFLAAAHGKSENGRFHMVPQDYKSSEIGRAHV